MPFYAYLADPQKCLLDLEATRPHVRVIMEEINKLNLASDDDRPALLAARKAAIKDIALRLNGTLASELAVAQAYHVTRKGAFNLALLVGDATAIFSDEVRSAMDPDEQYDIVQADRAAARLEAEVRPRS